jgi:hypothetical protein
VPSGPTTEDDPAQPEGPDRLPVPLRPLTVIDVIDGGITAIKVAPREMLAASAPFVIPVQVASALALRGRLGSDVSLRDSFSYGSQGAFAENLNGVEVLLGVLSSVALVFAGAAVSRVICSWYIGTPMAAGTAVRGVVRRAPAVVALWFLVHVAEALGAVGLLVGAVLVVPFFVAAAPILAVEGIGPWTAFRRAIQLTRRRYQFALGSVLMVVVVASLLSALAAVVGALLAGVVDSTASALGFDAGWAWVLEVAGSAGAALVVVPFVAATSTLVYLDLRIRNEGLDIELAAIEQFGPA